jgi:hypothetical protein
MTFHQTTESTYLKGIICSKFGSCLFQTTEVRPINQITRLHKVYPFSNRKMSLVTNSKKKALLEKLIVAQLVKNFPFFYENLRFITVFIRTNNRSLLSGR